MRNVLRVFGRDAMRIAKTPATWLVLAFLIVLPSLYTWFNVAGFWNPYDNTGALRVCVVNEDRGVSDERLGELDLGTTITGKLAENTQLGWEFVNRDEAIEKVTSGEAYAAIVIPPEFSENMASILTTDFTRPTLEYYVNEKVSPVSPKITDKGANALDTLINDEFVSTASEVVTERLNEGVADIDAGLARGRDTAYEKATGARDAVTQTREALANLSDKCSTASQKATDAKSSLASAKTRLQALSTALSDSAYLISTANTGIAGFSLTVGTALDGGSASLSRAGVVANEAVSSAAGSISTAASGVNAAIASGEAVAQEVSEASTLMSTLASQLPEGDAKTRAAELASQLSQRSSDAQASLASLRTLSTDISNAATSTSAAASAIVNASASAISAADSTRSTLASDTIPTISNGLAGIATATSTLSAAAASQTALIDESSVALSELASTLSLSSGAITQTDTLLATLEGDLDTLATDIATIDSANAITTLFGDDGIDPNRVAEFMRSPTEVRTVELYPLNAYGSAMAPLFINLTLWIGVFMLMVIMRMEVDSEKIKELTVGQRFFGRYLLLAVPAALQAVVCCVGCLILGVQSASVVRFVLTAVIASLAYLCIQYTLSTTLQHVGKGLCVILVFVQIPGATGLYPVEMTNPFFQTVYPLFPFTYGINAIRETISGFYGTLWITNLAILIAFAAAFLAIGSIVRPWLANLNHLFARQVEESDIIIIEPVMLPERRFRASELIRLVYDRDEYHGTIERSARRFISFYSRFKMWALGIGIVVPIVVTTAMSFAQADKVIVLTAWLIWLLLIVFALVAVEYLHESVARRVALESMSDDEVRDLYAQSDSRLARLRRNRRKAEAERLTPDIPTGIVDSQTPDVIPPEGGGD